MIHMARALLLLVLGLALLGWSPLLLGSAELIEHTFLVQNVTVNKLCKEQVIVGVNGSSPGPLLRVHEGDRVIIHVLNESPYNVTIHWHGVFQLLSAWADGTEYTTQCPIQPRQRYTYRFNITQQEGTLLWHAHFAWLRATVYGGIIILPRKGRSYPFSKPYEEQLIILGEWFNANVMDVERQSIVTGGAPNLSNAYLINGEPGDLYPCSKQGTYKIEVVRGKTYLLRIINAALNNQLFFKIAHHKMIVVSVDASYTDPYKTDVLLVAPGQSTDVLLTADQPIGSYYMAASPYETAVAPGYDFNNSTTTGIIVYKESTSLTPIMPVMPPPYDTPTAHRFSSNLTGLVKGRFYRPVPRKVDEHILMTLGLGLMSCGKNETCAGPLGYRFAATVSNFSFAFPSKLSILEAHFYKVGGIYNATLPNEPLKPYDYVNLNNSVNPNVLWTSKSTTVKELKYGSVVQIVFQNTAVVGTENHPMHLHGFDFHVLAQGFGVYDPKRDSKKFNLRNPQTRNTIGVPQGGWTVIRFQANNPGVWLLHCHVDTHVTWGMLSSFIVGNGGTPSTTLPPPPPDLPKCFKLFGDSDINV